MMQKINSFAVKKLLASKHSKDFFACEVKTGASNEGLGIIDAWAMKKSWAHPLITGYEIKVSRQDFLNDNKWRKYLNYCNEFYFVCPKDIIMKGEVPDDVGLYYIGKRLKTVKKAPYRDIKICDDIFRYILMNKIQSDWYPFHGSKLEYWKDYVNNKRTASDLGYLVSSKMITRLKELEYDVKQNKSNSDELMEIRKFLNENNISGWSTIKQIENLMDNEIIGTRKKIEELREYLRDFRI